MDRLLAYWSAGELITNGVLLLHLVGAAVVGMVMGYERSYHGRAAGIRTYTLVCMATCMLTSITGYPAEWFGGLAATSVAADPTRVIQGIMTGIGFLGAGVIMREGFTIRGLSTAASIWMTAAIGVVIGVGFYGMAISAMGLSVLVMSGLRKAEAALPHLRVFHLNLAYARESAVTNEEIRGRMKAHGFEIIDWSFQLGEKGTQFEYQLVLQAMQAHSVTDLLNDLTQAKEVLEFRLTPSRD